MKIIYLSVLVLCIIGCGKSSTPLTDDPTGLNLDFEQSSYDGTPTKWYVSKEESYNAYLDSEIVFSGKKSLRINFLGQVEEHSFGVGTATLPLDEVRGKKITYTGYIRTQSVSDGYAGLWFRVDGKASDDILAFDNMNDRGVKGTTDWKQYKIELPVDSSVTNINFGVIHTGKGNAWFDKLELLIDGKPYVQKIFTATNEQMEWLKQNAKSFNSPLAGSGYDDLAPIKEIVGDAEIVGLGEATHGTKEFFQMKHRLTEYLADNMGYTIFAIEANMPEAYKINDYVLGGQGNVRELLNGMYFWTWNTKEVEAMIEWMRTYNASGKGRIEFTGFDMQTADVAAEIVVSFLDKHDHSYVGPVKKNYEEFKKATEKMYSRGGQSQSDSLSFAPYIENAAAALSRLQSSDYKNVTQKELDWAIQNANVALQAIKITDMYSSRSGGTYRDSCMAENIKWIKDHAPANTKIIVWAHNGHIAKSEDGVMGEYLNKMYGSKYRPIGFKFHEGTYTAWGRGSLSSSNVALPSYTGTLDWVLHSLGMPRFILNMRSVSATDTRSSWLHQDLPTKSIGAMAIDGYYPEQTANAFDALIYFDKTTASECYRVIDK